MIDNLLIFLNFIGLTISKFEKEVGLSNGLIGKLSKNNGTLGGDKLEKILIKYPELNINWLLTGNGEMLNSGSNIQKNKGTGNIIQNGNGNISGTINIGGEMHSKKSIEERLKGMVHEIRNLRTQVDNLNKIIEEKERLIKTKDQIIELLKSK